MKRPIEEYKTKHRHIYLKKKGSCYVFFSIPLKGNKNPSKDRFMHLAKTELEGLDYFHHYKAKMGGEWDTKKNGKWCKGGR